MHVHSGVRHAHPWWVGGRRAGTAFLTHNAPGGLDALGTLLSSPLLPDLSVLTSSGPGCVQPNENACF